jgi:ATP-dependent helicase/DNAse subunit B
MNENYSFLIEDMVWSFSRLNSFLQCPYQFKTQYIDCERGIQNFFAEFGSHCHGILEKYCKNEAKLCELADIYTKTYNKAINFTAPPNKFVDLNQTYYDSGLEYFNNFKGFGNYEIVGVEKEVKFNINNIKIKGYIDLLMKDKEGNLHIIDHKSSDPKSAKSEKAMEYWKQMTLYAIGVYEEYGQYPVKLHINAFRKQQWFKIDFDINQVQIVKDWVVETVDKIMKETKYLPLSDDYFCRFLCNFRNTCEYKG